MLRYIETTWRRRGSSSTTRMRRLTRLLTRLGATFVEGFRTWPEYRQGVSGQIGAHGLVTQPFPGCSAAGLGVLRRAGTVEAETHHAVADPDAFELLAGDAEHRAGAEQVLEVEGLLD